jgi:putative peptidoglycan lipid II flippase
LVRDQVIAWIFGAGAATDAFFVAFKIPNFMRRLFAEGAFSLAFVPVLSEYKSQRPLELKAFIDRVAGTLGAALLLVTLVGVIGAPVVIAIFAPGFLGAEGEAKYALAVEMLRLTFPYLFFISLTAFAGGILNAHNRFAVPAFTPVLLNLSLIGCALGLTTYMPEGKEVMALAWGVLLAGILQLAFQLPFLQRLHLLPKPVLAPKDEGVRRIGRLMLPALFGVSVSQINLLLDTLIASFLVSGSITWLYYSDRLMEFPLGMLGVALGTVILPNLSRNHAEQSPQEFSDTMDWALRWVLFLGLPAAVGLFVLGGPMLATLFQYRAFTGEDVAMAERSLMAYSFGLVGFILIKVLAPGFYARQDTKTPVRIAVIAMVSNMVFNIILVFPLAHAGLALATTLSAYLNAFLLFRGLRREAVYRPQSGWASLILRGALACGAMAGLLLWGAGDLDSWLVLDVWGRVWRLLAWIGAGAGIYFVVLFALGIRPRHFRRSV